MNDPHVVALIYRVEHSDKFDFTHAEPFVREEATFRLEVRDNQARFELQEHYATEAHAQRAVEKYISGWEFDACLEHEDPDYFRLKYDAAEIEDRNPTPGVTTINARTLHVQVSIPPATVISSPGRYPTPPSDVRVDVDVEAMYRRYMGYRQGREPLGSMAYFCLTVLEMNAGGRSNASTKFQISVRVLSTIGRLAGQKGGSEARKARGVGKELTNRERRFLEEATKRIIRRTAEKAEDCAKDLPQISMNDLPQI